MGRTGRLLALIVCALAVFGGGPAKGTAQSRSVAGLVDARVGLPPAEALREQRAVAKLASRALPVFCGGGRANEVALTFDDGPTASTPRLLAALRRSPTARGVPATFFLIGASATRHRGYTRAEAAIGAVGVHTQTHAALTALGVAAARRDIVQGKESVERALGRRVELFRPPGGHRTPTIDRIVAREGLLTVMYAVDPRDWAMRSASSIAGAVASDPRLVPGAIVLLHEFNRATIEAVPAIVRGLRRQGLRPVSVPRLLADDPPTLAERREDARAGSCVHLYRRRS